MNETTKSDGEVQKWPTARLHALLREARTLGAYCNLGPLRTEPDIFGDFETEESRRINIGRCVERIRAIEARGADYFSAETWHARDVDEAARLAEADHPKHSIGWRTKD